MSQGAPAVKPDTGYMNPVLYGRELDGITRLDMGRYVAEQTGPLPAIVGTTSEVYDRYEGTRDAMTIDNVLELGIALRCFALAEKVLERVNIHFNIEYLGWREPSTSSSSSSDQDDDQDDGDEDLSLIHI